MGRQKLEGRGETRGEMSTQVDVRQEARRFLRLERYNELLKLLTDRGVADLPPAERLALEAQARVGLAEFEPAERCAREALTLNLAEPGAFYVLGAIAQKLREQPAEAAQWYRQALQADPDFAPAQYSLGLLLLEAGYGEQATSALRRAHALDPKDWRYSAGVALLEPPQARAAALRAAYQAGLREQPGSIRLRLRLYGTYLSGVLAPFVGTAAVPAITAQRGVDAYRRLLARPVLATYVLLAINVAMYLLMESQGGSQTTSVLERFGAEDPTAIVHQQQWWRLLTPLFLHAGLVHLAVNSVSLYFVGILYERCVGVPRFLFVYLVAGVGGSIASMAFTQSLAVGASGAIFGIFGALGVYFFRNRMLFGKISRSLVRQILILGAVNLLLPNVVANVDGWAHVGGLLAGIAAAWVAGPLLPSPTAAVADSSLLEEQRSTTQQVLQMAVVVVIIVLAAVAIIAWNPAGA